MSANHRTDFSKIKFNKEYHTYTLDGKQLPSVTKLIGQLKLPFDRHGIAARSAAKEGVSVETILARWDAEAEVGRWRGNQVHDYIEQVLRGVALPADNPFLALNQKLPEIDAFNNCWKLIRPLVHVEEIEWVVGDRDLAVAGTCDTVLYNQTTGFYHIWDWKTGKRFNLGNQFENLLEPFADLENCELCVYSLQTSLYRLIIERNTDLNLGDSYIVHLSREGKYQIHKAEDLRARLAAWLTGGPKVAPVLAGGVRRNSEEAG